ncbi:hypothetical protein Tco_1448018 [Tanacetum coccineum]
MMSSLSYASVMRTASAAAKPCQEDSSEFYLITGIIYTDQRGTVVFPMVAAARRRQQRGVKVKELRERCTSNAFKLSYQEKYEHVDPQDGKRSQVDDMRLCLVNDLKKLKITFKLSTYCQAKA